MQHSIRLDPALLSDRTGAAHTNTVCLHPPNKLVAPIGLNVPESLNAELKAKIAGWTRSAVPPETMRHASVSLGRHELDAAFVDRTLPPGLHQSASLRPEDGSAALILPVAVALAGPGHTSGVRLIMVQEDDAVAERGTVHGPGMMALGLPPAGVVFVRVRSAIQALRVADEAMRTQAAPAIVLELRRGEALIDLSVTRRFHLAARRAGLFVFLLTSARAQTGAVATRWHVASAPSRGVRRRLGLPAFHLDLVRNRHGQTGRWLVEWSAHDRRFLSAQRVKDEPDQTLSAPVAAAPGRRSRAA